MNSTIESLTRYVLSAERLERSVLLLITITYRLKVLKMPDYIEIKQSPKYTIARIGKRSLTQLKESIKAM